MIRFILHLTITGILAATVACSPTAEAPQETVATPTPTQDAGKEARTQEFQVRGVIKELPETGTSVRIHHEEIPGFMNAMTMPFTVKDRNELSKLSEGDTISFTLHVTDTESWIDQLQPVQSGVTPGQMPSVSSVRIVREVEPLEVGDPMPNYPFVDQDGNAFELDDFRGKALVITFIYTRCPIPDFCPRMSLNFGEAYRALTATEDQPDNWHFLSLSFDPANDTPEALKRYAEAYSFDSKKWSFATGEIIEIDAITEQFGLVFSRSAESVNDWDHNLRTVIIDPSGTIRNIYIGNTWETKTLVEDIQTALKTPETLPAAE